MRNTVEDEAEKYIWIRFEKYNKRKKVYLGLVEEQQEENWREGPRSKSI